MSEKCPGNVVTRTGDREIRCVSGRLPDNPGELAKMYRANFSELTPKGTRSHQ